jgi:uncharacterized repeat protein (TIGR03843 family)
VSLLAAGRIEIEGRMPWSSNGTYLCTVTGDGPDPSYGPDNSGAGPDSSGAGPDDSGAGPDDSGDGPDPSGGRPGDGRSMPVRSLRAIYKPWRAERPLWDFPDGLYRREVGAYELSVALGWDLVPETVEREEAPLGLGSLQRFVDADYEQHYFTLLEDDRHHPALQRMGVFDVIANNADRKGGHCLVDRVGHIWGIDHGLCFHESPKLRTVIWDWAGETIDDAVMADVAAFCERPLSPALRHLLTADEQEALVHRARALVHRPRFPEPRNDRAYPWPLV